ncbi:hypothetical protein K6U06_05500 [Acidiferrimicrobium sp. IK]|uniref:hypothetical protein n=1 Tax=Acidiferrimicrobium sp. IK TaxID=2871700 RepID=UPI0021CB048C|nr:hypothetical protein [Acidiferrimicrobium sp. IK]MCU4183807.1 hypothetical protein [Acidiferrimicrobium sp. IK]
MDASEDTMTEEQRRAMLEPLGHLDDLSPEDEEEITRFRAFMNPAQRRGRVSAGHLLGRLHLGHGLRS